MRVALALVCLASARCATMSPSIGASSLAETPPGAPPPDAPGRLWLPYAPGSAYLVAQGNDGPNTHAGRERFAWDFELPVGTPVLSSGGGRVVEVEDGYSGHGLGAAWAERANSVVVDLGDGRFAVYRHLAPKSAAVRVGELVAAGQILARSGDTGMTASAHLHFAVVDHVNQSLPARFEDVPEGIPRQGQRPTSGNVRRAGPSPTFAASRLPRETFAAGGVLLSHEPVVRVLCEGETLELRGDALRPGRVVAFVLPRAGGAPLLHSVATRDEGGQFVATLELRGVRGLLGLALAIAGPNGAFASEHSVPITVLPTDTCAHTPSPQAMHSARNFLLPRRQG